MSVTLTTNRLILRPYALDDAPALATELGDKRVAWTLGRVPHPYTLEDAHAFLGRVVGDDSAPGFAITRADDGQLIGACGVHLRDKDEDGIWELGYWIAHSAWGQGYATEAASAVVSHGFETQNTDTIWAGYFSDNPASGRVLEKIGFDNDGEGEYWCEARQKAVPHRWLRLAREKWINRTAS